MHLVRWLIQLDTKLLLKLQIISEDSLLVFVKLHFFEIIFYSNRSNNCCRKISTRENFSYWWWCSGSQCDWNSQKYGMYILENFFVFAFSNFIVVKQLVLSKYQPDRCLFAIPICSDMLTYQFFFLIQMGIFD